MSAGKLDKRITLQAEINTSDLYGQNVKTWTDVVTVWAEFITTGGKEFYAAQKLHEETTAVIRIRYRKGLNSRMRVKYGNRYYEIIGHPNDVGMRHKEILLTCKDVE